MLTESHPASQVVPELKPAKGELVIRKARDCVGDRAAGPHAANLFDMEQKYADILARDEIIAALKGR